MLILPAVVRFSCHIMNAMLSMKTAVRTIQSNRVFSNIVLLHMEDILDTTLTT